VKTALFGLVALGALPCFAQTYPAKPIRYILAFPPGGSNDIFARIVGVRMSDVMGVPVIIDNRPGGAANIGAEAIARAAPDGYTIGNISATHAINATLFPKLGYDVLKDFTPIARVVEVTVLFAAHPVLPVKTAKDVVALARQRPLTYGSAGVGTPGHLAAEMLRGYGAKELTHVPYKGGGPASVDLVAGQIELLFQNMPDLVQFVNAGKIRAIAVLSAKRDPVLSSVPTMIESGFPGFELANWLAIVGPANIPKEIVARLNGEITKILNEPATRDKIAAQGFNVATSTSEDLGRFIRSEYEKWGKLVKASGAKVD
jgi:tripartite-type tricarboxylate transporter receptor subunit TctC